jgi:hypothetical protein
LILLVWFLKAGAAKLKLLFIKGYMSKCYTPLTRVKGRDGLVGIGVGCGYHSITRRGGFDWQVAWMKHSKG